MPGPALLNGSLYGLTVLIWGSFRIVPKFQVGPVAPEISVGYRFALVVQLTEGEEE